MDTAVMTTANNHNNRLFDVEDDEDRQVDQLLRSVFQMCDVTGSGQISVDDLLTLGRQYLGQDTKVSWYFLELHLQDARGFFFFWIMAGNVWGFDSYNYFYENHNDICTIWK